MSMKAWAEAHPDLFGNTEENVELQVSPIEESTTANEEEETPKLELPRRAGSCISSQGRSPDERREEREFRLQMAKLRMEESIAERAVADAERAAKRAAERAFEEKKLLLAQEVSLRELEIKARQVASSTDGSSVAAVLAG